MINLRKTILTALALAALAAQSAATLSGTVYFAEDPHVAYGPLAAYFYNKYEPLNNSINIASTRLEINLAAWIYANYTDSTCRVSVKINGTIYVYSWFDVPTVKTITPNCYCVWNIPESAFNVGTNDVEYRLEFFQKEEGEEHTFLYKAQVIRS